jgi:hypothetical protein
MTLKKISLIAACILVSHVGNSHNFVVNLKELNQQLFTCIYKTNAWGDPESASGPGSSLGQTKILRAEFPKMLKKFGIQTLLDAPCGDFNWMNAIKDELSLNLYIGVDIVPDIIRSNITKHGANGKRIFMHKNIIEDELPQADAVICRDCLTHMPYSDIWAALKNFKKSGIKYLLISTYPNRSTNIDLRIEHLFNLLRYRPLNFQREPFNFPAPLWIINEGNTEGNGNIADKSLALWRIEDLPLSE